MMFLTKFSAKLIKSRFAGLTLRSHQMLVVPSSFYFSSGKNNEAQPNIYDSYRGMTAEEKQARQKKRRLAKRYGDQDLIDPAVYQGEVNSTLRKMEVAFTELATENAPGRV